MAAHRGAMESLRRRVEADEAGAAAARGERDDARAMSQLRDVRAQRDALAAAAGEAARAERENVAAV